MESKNKIHQWWKKILIKFLAILPSRNFEYVFQISDIFIFPVSSASVGSVRPCSRAPSSRSVKHTSTNSYCKCYCLHDKTKTQLKNVSNTVQVILMSGDSESDALTSLYPQPQLCCHGILTRDCAGSQLSWNYPSQQKYVSRCGLGWLRWGCFAFTFREYK